MNTGRPWPDDKTYQKFTSCYIDVLNSPLYPFGYGLSYTTFSYGKMRLDHNTMSEDGEIKVSVDVTNSGSMDADEVVQLYIRDLVASVSRTVKELKDFQRVSLKAGETKTVTFTINAEKLKFYNSNLKWVCEPGDFQVMVGPNCRDVQTETFTME